MGETEPSDAEVFRLINAEDWAAIHALIEGGQLKPNRKVVVQMLAARYTLPLLPVMVEHKANAVVKSLLDKGANPDQRYEGATPLLIACEAGNREAVDLLLNAGADFEQSTAIAEGEGGQTALMIARKTMMFGQWNDC